ncbi:MAG TPA: prolyl oligopeptidase family serine peptidase [Candidatus Dormibacteraeota bacterium]|jgi:dipeptidyl aminopeptidase/acylaminoacyl peptidase|nr:prolyl oligopeptidase family serine peptidase [Candidatus Dormibacteraeota bacterium]
MRNKWLASGMLAGVAIALFIAPYLAVSADEKKDGAKKIEPWKPEDFIYTEVAGNVHISRDAKWAVWVKSTVDKEKDGRVSNLILSSLTDSTEIELTRGSDHYNSPVWSPNGERIAFLSDRKRLNSKGEAAGTQIWLMNPHGGEPWPLTEFARAPRRIDWLDNDTLIFSAQEDASLFEQEAKKKKDDSEVVDDEGHEPPVRLYKLSVKDKKVTRLTNNSDWIQGWSVSRDGKYAAASHGKSLRYAFDQKFPPVAVLHNLSDGTEKIIFTEGRVRPRGFEWASDNSGFYAAAPFSNDARFLTASIELLYFYDVNSGKSVQVPLDWENGIGSDLAATNDGFILGLAGGARYQMARYSREKSGDSWIWKRHNMDGEHARNLESFEVSEDGKTIVYSHSTASKLSQLYRAQIDGDKISSPVQITKLNQGLVNGRSYAKSEVIHWIGSNNEEVEGILYYPQNYEAGKKYPLITAIHGGPMGADKDLWGESWAYPIQLFTQRGAFVLRPNYHGSNDYGLKWAESICCGHYYDLETPDINAGVDYLIAKGMVDPDRVATMGWSNGSILSTSLLITYPDRYKVASVGAGDIEWFSDWANVDFGESFDAYYFGKSPFQDPELYIKKSPVFKMDRIKAPVLIFHGSEDRNVPFAQSWTYFRTLQWHGKVPVKFVIFPGEPHGPRKLTHQVRKVTEEVSWFDKYFFKTEKPFNEALKEGSPLETAFRAKNVAVSGARYGAEFGAKPKTVLIPEVVKRNDMEIGRFEVTEAQFAQYRTLTCFASSSKNKNDQCLEFQELVRFMQDFPQANVSLEEAKAYVDWLSKITNMTWRLPYEDEVKALYESRDGENTLDYWAGYAPNPEDAARLREKAKELKNAARLLKEVGTFRGQGKDDEEPIYDLGGNVAEWVLSRDGKGKVIGGSADCPADPRSNCTPAPEYVGFRVVRGAAKPDAAK